MNERRGGARHMVSFPVRVKWRGEDGKEIVQEGLTENVGPSGTLIYLPRNLPLVGGKVHLTVTEDPKNEVTVTASVIRLERNAAHPQAALQLIDGMRAWKKQVWEYAGELIAAQEPEALDDW
ncbi:MAG: PilZ domain-containing protein [Blastocatellia bacterium]|nr:PilZ domain-containing protein [Blastocatellia bacterium]